MGTLSRCIYIFKILIHTVRLLYKKSYFISHIHLVWERSFPYNFISTDYSQSLKLLQIWWVKRIFAWLLQKLSLCLVDMCISYCNKLPIPTLPSWISYRIMCLSLTNFQEPNVCDNIKPLLVVCIVTYIYGLLSYIQYNILWTLLQKE